jgi:hypothetical protein
MLAVNPHIHLSLITFSTTNKIIKLPENWQEFERTWPWAHLSENDGHFVKFGPMVNNELR